MRLEWLNLGHSRGSQQRVTWSVKWWIDTHSCLIHSPTSIEQQLKAVQELRVMIEKSSLPLQLGEKLLGFWGWLSFYFSVLTHEHAISLWQIWKTRGNVYFLKNINNQNWKKKKWKITIDESKRMIQMKRPRHRWFQSNYLIFKEWIIPLFFKWFQVM